MKKIVSMIVMLFVLAFSASAYSVNLHGDDGCYADGPHYNGSLNGWGFPTQGNYGGQGFDTFCLIVEPGMCNEWEQGSLASFDISTPEMVNVMEVKYLNGQSGVDNFDLYLYDPTGRQYFVGTVVADDGSAEEWMTTQVALPVTIPAYQTWKLEFEAEGPAWEHCDTYGQVAIDYIDLWYDEEIPEFGLLAGVIAGVGALAGFMVLRRR